MKSPWGSVQQSKEYAKGVTFVSTAGHGGFKLDRTHNAKIPLVFRNKGGWYEEDCEWAKVAITFPELFNEEMNALAHKTAKNWFPDEYEKHFNVVINTDASIVKRDRAFKIENYHNFVVKAAWGDWHNLVPQGMVVVLAIKESTGERKFFKIAKQEYNNNGFVINPDIHQESNPIV